MSVKTEKLLSLYKTYEGLVREAGEDVIEAENSLPELESNQMRLIRQTRNFLAHNHAPGFVEPTEKMLVFLEAKVGDWKLRGAVAKNSLKTPASSMCKEGDPCAEGLRKLARLRRSRLPACFEDGSIRLFDLFALAAAVAADPGALIQNVRPMKETPVFVPPDAPVASLDPHRVNICTKTGEPDGKILGVVMC